MSDLFARVAALPCAVDGYALRGLSADTSSGGRRVTTLITLTGGGTDGVGEDVTYQEEDQVAFQRAGQAHDLGGKWTLGDLFERIEAIDLFPTPPQAEFSRRFRVWAFQSAAIDLALRQAGQSLHAVLGHPPEPMRYVASLRLGDPPAIDPMQRRLDLDPSLRFKLDATSEWTPELIAAIARTGAVDSIDFKAMYRGTPVDQPADPVLYRRVVDAFPHAWLEDPDILDPATAEILQAEHDRITWDAPIHGVADIKALAFAPKMVNLKPSRIGPARELFAAYDYCAAHGISAYSGGQTELGPGRGQAQYLASLFHADAPNDLAPAAYNLPDPPAGLPPSPLTPDLGHPGFRWQP